MKVTLDAYRFVHLVALIGMSSIGAWVFITFFQWTPLVAFGTACTVVTQLSNLVLTVASASGTSSDTVPVDEKIKKSKNKSLGGNPKKKKTL